MHPDASRLFAAEASLRAEADAVPMGDPRSVFPSPVWYDAQDTRASLQKRLPVPHCALTPAGGPAAEDGGARRKVEDTGRRDGIGRRPPLAGGATEGL
jgi:hypothetical protein